MSATKKKKAKVTVQHSAEIRCLYQTCKVRGKKLYQMYEKFGYKKSTIYEHARKPIAGEAVFDKRATNKGRPRTFTKRDDVAVNRAVKKLRKEKGTFASRHIQVEAGQTQASNRTTRRSLNRQGYKYTNTRRKGILKEEDLKIRLDFCKQIKKLKLGREFWEQGISMYVDGVGFEHKTNPRDDARCPTAKEWIRDKDTLSLGCTAKGKKEGAHNANFMVGISSGAGVVLAEQYEGQITGQKMADIVGDAFDDAFERCAQPCSRRILQDNCTRQNSKAARDAIDAHRGWIFNIPARSPDLNPIENFFNTLKKALKKEALTKNITHETFEQFSRRCEEVMRRFPASEIDKIIESMPRRIDAVIKGKGNRTKY